MFRKIPSEILREPDSRLHDKAMEVKIFNHEVEGISEKLCHIVKMLDFRGHIFGLGLAAPQLGIPKRMIVLKQSFNNYLVMVNPTILLQKFHLPWIEGCFSVKGFHRTKRFFLVRVSYQDTAGNPHERTLFGPRAAVLQQEIDHLDGILISDH